MGILTIRVCVALNKKRDTATIKMGNASNPIVVPCLGVESNNDDSIVKIYLNAKLHNDNKDVNYEGWAMSGAVSTILKKVDIPEY